MVSRMDFASWQVQVRYPLHPLFLILIVMIILIVMVMLVMIMKSAFERIAYELWNVLVKDHSKLEEKKKKMSMENLLLCEHELKEMTIKFMEMR